MLPQRQYKGSLSSNLTSWQGYTTFLDLFYWHALIDSKCKCHFFDMDIWHFSTWFKNVRITKILSGSFIWWNVVSNPNMPGSGQLTHLSPTSLFSSNNLSIPPSISGTHVSLRASLLLCFPLCFWQTYQHSTNTASHTHAALCKLNLHPSSTDRLVCVCVCACVCVCVCVCGHIIWQAWMVQIKT